MGAIRAGGWSVLPMVILGAGSEPAEAARSSASRITCCARASRADTFLPLPSPASDAEHRNRTKPTLSTPRPRLRAGRLGAGNKGPRNRREGTWRKPSRRRPVLRRALAISLSVEGGGRRENQTGTTRQHGDEEEEVEMIWAWWLSEAICVG
jgi:hypothetical protein